MQSSSAELVGRAEELRALKALLTRARNGLAGSMVIRGEPGIGKTALLTGVTTNLTDVDVIPVDGFQAELSMPYAALHRAGMPLRQHLAALPDRQRQALNVAWGVTDGPAPDRYLVGLGILSLFAEAGGTRPVVCVVDDAHWVDSESRDVLAFVARRLQAESTVLLFATRDSSDSDVQLAGIPSLRLTGLDTLASVQLMTTSAVRNIDPFVATQIAAATGGNPLALIDLARDMNIRQMGHLSLPSDPVAIGTQLEAHYLRQVRQMSTAVQHWLLLAAAEQTGNNDLITNAAAALGLPPDCAVDADHAGLVRHDGAVAFRHPLVRSAVYGASPGGERRRVHAALAKEAGALGLSEVEAWHAAEATTDDDAVVADRLEVVAEQAARRGGLASQARLLARAAHHTPAGPQRNGRLLSAAEAAGTAGAVQLSRELLDRIDPDELGAVERGRLIVVRAELAIFLADPAPIVASPASMLSAAEHFHGQAPDLERRALLRAFECMFVADYLAEDITLPKLGSRLAAAVALQHNDYATVLRGLSAHTLLPYPQAVPLIRQALDVLLQLDAEELAQFGFVGAVLATALFDERAGREYLDRLAQIARDAGALRTLDTVLWIRSLFELDHGDPAACGRYVKQVRELRQAIGYEAENVVNVAYLAWTGAPRDEIELIAEAARSMGYGGVHRSAMTALGIRALAEREYDQAYARLKPMIDPPMLQVTYIRLADFVEAALRSGHREDAAVTAQSIATMAAAGGTDHLCGLDQRCQALLASDSEAETHYQRAIDLLSLDEVPAERGRAHLLYGEWLRRLKRRRDARHQLRAAIEIFDRIEAPAFAERARSELAATGEKSGVPHIVDGVEMSSQEAAAARMAAEGKTNAEIGAALFVSVNTVDYHLRKVFGKLGISSRRQLRERFGTPRS